MKIWENINFTSSSIIPSTNIFFNRIFGLEVVNGAQWIVKRANTGQVYYVCIYLQWLHLRAGISHAIGTDATRLQLFIVRRLQHVSQKYNFGK